MSFALVGPYHLASAGRVEANEPSSRESAEKALLPEHCHSLPSCVGFLLHRQPTPQEGGRADGANSIISIIMDTVLDAWQLRGVLKLEKAAKQLEALGNSTRLQVYRTLVRAGDAGLPVGRLQEKLGIPAPPQGGAGPPRPFECRDCA